MTEFQHIFLSTFKPSDLIFDEEETKDILKFFFQNDEKFIDGLVTNKPAVAVIAYNLDIFNRIIWG